MIGLSIWYIISAIKHYFHQKYRRLDYEDLVLFIKKIEAERSQEPNAACILNS
jgi:hypothetical protein